MKHDRERCPVLKASSWEACEDHLGVTLIQSGRRRYRQKGSWVFLQNTNKGGTAGIYISSLSLMKGRDFFNLREGKVRIPASLLARYLSAPATPSGLAKHDARGLREGKERARETARGREA